MLTLCTHDIMYLGERMVTWLQKISTGNESRVEGGNDEMSVPNYRYPRIPPPPPQPLPPSSVSAGLIKQKFHTFSNHCKNYWGKKQHYQGTIISR